MKRPAITLLLLLIPALLIIFGFYLKNDVFYSLGAVVLIFYIIMTLIEKFRGDKRSGK